MRLVWSPRSLRDRQSIRRFIARDRESIPVARAWDARIAARARKACGFPRAGRMVPEFGREELREVFLGTYRIIYRVHAKTLEVAAVVEGHQLLTLDELP